MQEEVEQRSVTLAIQTTKLTARTLRAAMRFFLRESGKIKNRHTQPKQGKQTVKQLIRQEAGASNIEVSKEHIRGFERVARKYGIDYAIRKDESQQPPKYLVFFKARDNDALTAAFKEFTSKTIRKAQRPSVVEKLQRFKEIAKSLNVSKVRNKEQERSI